MKRCRILLGLFAAFIRIINSQRIYTKKYPEILLPVANRIEGIISTIHNRTIFEIIISTKTLRSFYFK